MDNYEITKTIAEGAFGIVKKAFRKKDK